MDTNPRIGDIVHYIPSDDEVEKAASSAVHVWETNRHYAAIILRVFMGDLVLLARVSEWGWDSPRHEGTVLTGHETIHRSSTPEPGYWHSGEDCDQ